MEKPIMERLLKLQECDARCNKIKDQLRRIPLEIEDYGKRIEKERGAMEDRQSAIRELELRRKNLDNEIGTAEEQQVKYRNQQLLVKKNDEYRALQHEIDTLSASISDLEDQAITLLLEIDGATAQAREAEVGHRKKIAEFEGQILLRKQHQEEFSALLGEAQRSVEEATSTLEEKVLKVYRYVKTRAKRPPFLVPLMGHKCTGCHLRVPTDLEMETRKSEELILCGNCSRIIYWPNPKTQSSV